MTSHFVGRVSPVFFFFDNVSGHHILLAGCPLSSFLITFLYIACCWQGAPCLLSSSVSTRSSTLDAGTGLCVLYVSMNPGLPSSEYLEDILRHNSSTGIHSILRLSSAWTALSKDVRLMWFATTFAGKHFWCISCSCTAELNYPTLFSISILK